MIHFVGHRCMYFVQFRQDTDLNFLFLWREWDLWPSKKHIYLKTKKAEYRYLVGPEVYPEVFLLDERSTSYYVTAHKTLVVSLSLPCVCILIKINKPGFASAAVLLHIPLALSRECIFVLLRSKVYDICPNHLL
jgi:hypothetical protein